MLVDDAVPSRLGAALAWALRSQVAGLRVLVEGQWAASVIARRAALFAMAPAVFEVRGRSLHQATPAPSCPPPEPPPAPGVQALLDLLTAHGIDPVVEHGVAKGEVLGLEVARVVGDGEGRHRLEVGVGSHDRQARAGLRPDEDVGGALNEVLAVVRRWRMAGARRHPANILSQERWLRTVVLARPDVVGAGLLERRPPALPGGDLRLPEPAAASGSDGDGSALVVVCSTGVDVDLVPTAADHWLLDGRRARLRLVLPAGDDYPLTREMAGALAAPAEVVTVPRDWPALLA